MHDYSGRLGLTPIARPIGRTRFHGSLEPRSDLTYRLIENLIVNGANAHQSLLTGSLLRQCTFTSVDFSRCDLDGVRIEHCEFVGCNFNNVDVRSSTMSVTGFRGCNFDNSLHTDCTYNACCFEATSFKGAALSESTIRSGSWRGCDITGASFTRNEFLEVNITDVVLANCTFLYMIMKHCTLMRVTFNVESLGTIYGLTQNDIAASSLLHLGQSEPKPTVGNLVDSLIDVYEQRRWDLGAAVLKLNFRRGAPLYVISTYLRELVQWTKEQQIVKKDDVLFLGRIMEELAIENRLPIMTCLDALSAARALREELSADHAMTTAESTLQLFASSVSALLNRLLGQIEWDESEIVAMSDAPMVIHLTFIEKPLIDIAALLNDLAHSTGENVCCLTETLSVRTGSYEEALQTTLLTTAALQMFLVLVNGMVAQVTELRARWQILRRKRLPQTYIDRALQPTHLMPRRLADIADRIARRTSEMSWVNTPNIGGLSADNIISIEGDTSERRRLE